MQISTTGNPRHSKGNASWKNGNPNWQRMTNRPCLSKVETLVSRSHRCWQNWYVTFVNCSPPFYFFPQLVHSFISFLQRYFFEKWHVLDDFFYHFKVDCFHLFYFSLQYMLKKHNSVSYKRYSFVWSVIKNVLHEITLSSDILFMLISIPQTVSVNDISISGIRLRIQVKGLDIFRK